MIAPDILYWFAPAGSIIALLFAYKFYRDMMEYDEGTEKMKKIAGYVREGAYAYLKQQYRVVAIFFIFASLVLSFMAYVLHVQNPWLPFAFLTGGFFSALAGFIGMKTATNASARTAWAAKKSLNDGLIIAFRSGAVMGLTVVGLGLLYIAVWFYLLYYTHISELIFGYKMNLFEITTAMLAFGMGASAQALFARVGGGIYTKAADVGADLVGKTEVGIPEDDPRNPATIADNVGDNVGDVAGMGADLYESYCGSILATSALAVAAGLGLNGVLLPMLIASAGIIFSVVGIYFIKTREDATQKELLNALSKGMNISAILILIATFILVRVVLPSNTGVFWSIVSGLVAGILIGKSTEYYTSADFKPTQGIAQQSKTGPATVIIEGIATGMISTAIPVVVIGLCIFFSFYFAGGFDNLSLGLYGVSIAAVGMLSTLGITLATDAYGPIADNAGGNAEMSGLGDNVRKRTDALDALGNTTAATGKGFAIGSAALTALALLAAYIEGVRAGLLGIGEMAIPGTSIPTKTASITDFMNAYNITLMNPAVLIGMFSGSMLAFVFCALTMKAVGRAASKMIEEVRRQFREIKGIMDGTAEPDYSSCVKISTQAAQKEMILPAMLAIVTPVIIGLIFGVAGVMGMLAGGLSTGFVLAVFMANAGGSWDNAKKYIESGRFEGKGKGSDEHKATVVGDTVGDPFKDTSGPSLNILIKLMSMISVVFAGLIVKYNLWMYIR